MRRQVPHPERRRLRSPGLTAATCPGIRDPCRQAAGDEQDPDEGEPVQVHVHGSLEHLVGRGPEDPRDGHDVVVGGQELIQQQTLCHVAFLGALPLLPGWLPPSGEVAGGAADGHAAVSPVGCSQMVAAAEETRGRVRERPSPVPTR